MYDVSFLFCFRKIRQEVSFGFLRLFIYFSLFIYHPKMFLSFILICICCNFFRLVSFGIFSSQLGVILKVLKILIALITLLLFPSAMFFCFVTLTGSFFKILKITKINDVYDRF